jgi:hypothetical protein
MYTRKRKQKLGDPLNQKITRNQAVPADRNVLVLLAGGVNRCRGVGGRGHSSRAANLSDRSRAEDARTTAVAVRSHSGCDR